MENVSSSYDQLDVVKASEVPELIEQCLATGVNLLIYGEPGCGKSSIINGLAGEAYNVVALGAASLTEDTVNGIPVYDAATKTTPYAVPEWLQRVEKYHNDEPGKPIIVLLDELMNARNEVKDSLQMLLTDRCLPTLKDHKLPDNLVIVAATNTAEDTAEGEELSRPLKTRFMSVRMTNTPDEYKAYIASIIDEQFPHIKDVLGEKKASVFFDDVIDDMKDYWCDNTKFYGTNPRTIMNLFKTCEYIAGKTGELKMSDVTKVAQRTTGHRVSSANWAPDAPEKAAVVKMSTNDSIIPSDEALGMMNDAELEYTLTAITRNKIATTKKGLEAMMKINVLRARLAKKDGE